MVFRLLKWFLLLAAFAAAGYGYMAVRQSAVIEVVAPRIGPAVEVIYATGTVEPSVMVPVAPRSAARLIALFADEGHKVAKGQVLAQLEDDDLQKGLDDVKANLTLAEKEYRRRAALAKKDVVPKDQLDQALATLESARARVAQAEASLSYLKLTAPEDGVVIRRDGEVGELIAQNQPVFYLSCCKGLRISAEVDEEDIVEVKPSQKVLIGADAFPGQVFEGKVDSITPKGDPVARSYRVRISLPADAPLMIGMTADSNIILREEEKALLIPASALSDKTVYVLQDGAFQPRQIETGAITARAVEVRGGISAEDIILKDISALPKTGDAIQTKTVEWSVQ